MWRSATTRRQEVILRRDLTVGYLDPAHAPGILAYFPEVHASKNCHRALRKGTEGYNLPRNRSDVLWCEVCTTDDPEKATMRKINGRWIK